MIRISQNHDCCTTKGAAIQLSISIRSLDYLIATRKLATHRLEPVINFAALHIARMLKTRVKRGVREMWHGMHSRFRSESQSLREGRSDSIGLTRTSS